MGRPVCAQTSQSLRNFKKTHHDQLKFKKAAKSMPKQAKQSGEPQFKFPAVSRKSGLEVLELRGKEIFEVEGVLTESECESFIEAAEKLKFELQGSRGSAFGEAVRQNDRVAIKSPALAESLWQNAGMEEIFADIRIGSEKAIGLNPNIRFYRYQPGHKFGKHVDDSNKVGTAWTQYTLLIYLSGKHPSSKTTSSSQLNANSRLQGGETLFYACQDLKGHSSRNRNGRTLLQLIIQALDEPREHLSF